jgi:hypothetical protein
MTLPSTIGEFAVMPGSRSVTFFCTAASAASRRSIDTF